MEIFTSTPYQLVEILKSSVVRPEKVEEEEISSLESGDLAGDIPVFLLADMNIVLKSAKTPDEQAKEFTTQLEYVVNDAVDQVKFCNILAPAPCVERLKMDLTFVVDSSSSIGSANFEKVKSFVKQFVSRFEIGPDLTRVSIEKNILLMPKLLYANSSFIKIGVQNFGVE